MTTYLIDYENVREDGLTGLMQLRSTDKVVVFYTADNEKIGLKWFSGTQASVTAMKVAPGSQSLDKHLLSWLGYLIGMHAGDEFVIVSRDNGFAPVADFWNERAAGSAKVEVRQRIEKTAAPKSEQQQEQKAAAKKEKKREEKPAEPAEHTTVAEPGEADIAALTEKVKQIITESGSKDGEKSQLLMSSLCDALAADPVFRSVKSKGSFKASSFVKNLSSDFSVFRRSSNVWVSLVTSDDQEKTDSPATADTQQKPNSIADRLTEAGLEQSEVKDMLEAISTIKAEGNNVKQRVYRESLRRFQRGRGLEVYNSVKNLI